MTNPTPPGQVPDALPAIQRFEVVDCIDSKHVPAVIPKPHGPWVRYEDHAAALCRLHAENEALRAQQDDAYDHGPQAETVEEAARDVGKWLNERPNRPLDLRHVAMLTHHAKRTAHVQNPAEIEHVAGDVSKNGAELNTSTQQPAPATQQAMEHLFELWWAEYMPDATQDRAWKAWTEAPRTDGVGVAAPQPSPTASSAVLKAIRKANMQLVRTGDNAFMLVPYKAATAQAADSVPAVLSGDELVRLGKSPESGLYPWGIGTTRADYLRAVRAVLAAARAPAESVGRDAERERICAAIKAEDDYCVTEGDYMLDSNDCIKIVRGEWVRPDFSVAANGGNK